MFNKTRGIIIAITTIMVLTTMYITFTGRWQLVRGVITYPKMLQVRSVTPIEFEPQRSWNDLLSVEEMIADLQQFKKDYLEVHPSTIEGLSQEQEEAFAVAFERVQAPMYLYEFYILLAELTTELGDDHTVFIGNLQGTRIPLDFRIMEEGFFIVEERGGIQPGDKLISLGGVPIETLFEAHKKRTPAMNIYWANHVFETRPLLDTMITRLGGEVSPGFNIKVKIERNGEKIETTLHYFNPESQVRQRFLNEDNLFSYHINYEKSYVHFILRQCQYSEEYEKFLETMFTDIKENNIQNIIVDLRGNFGGSSMVVNAFLRYIDIEKILTSPVTIRFSEQVSKRAGYLGRRGYYNYPGHYEWNDKRDELLFGGNIYVLVDNGTFSAGMEFAVAISDNSLGTIIGRPTGGNPTLYGSAFRFQLKHSRLEYIMSSRKILRINAEKRYQGSLYPDYEIRYTIEDLIEGRDLDMEKAIELIMRSRNK